MRGFAAIALWEPKYDGNVGAAIRASSVFDARFVALIRNRAPSARGRIERTDPRASHRHMPVQFAEALQSVIPHESVPVAVEMVPGAECLANFEHPESALYVFGPEDGSLPKDALRQCHRVVRIPSSGCLNLAMAVNVVLYDRMAKALRTVPVEGEPVA